jgi:2-oxoglutarate ferredoxin oxidoreductase subunit alpha
MVEKRKQKIALVTSEAHPPEVLGQGSIAVIGWGSTKGAIMEALKSLDDPRLFQIHFTWVHPLDPQSLEILKQTETNIVIENNVTGTFADILKSHGIKIHHRILQANGFTFFVDLLKEKLLKVIKGLS